MSQYSEEVRRQRLERNRINYRTASQLKREMAKTLLARIQEELETNPETTDFDAELRRPLGRLERYLLRHHPDEISSRVKIGREVIAQLVEEVEPPVLRIHLGESAAESEE